MNILFIFNIPIDGVITTSMFKQAIVEPSSYVIHLQFASLALLLTFMISEQQGFSLPVFIGTQLLHPFKT